MLRKIIVYILMLILLAPTFPAHNYDDERQLTLFTDVSDDAGMPHIDAGHATFAWGDYNNDGFEDLLIDTIHGPLLFRNNGPPDYHFKNVTSDVGLYGFGMGNSVFVDYDNDGDLDIYTTWWDENIPSPLDILWENSGPPDYKFTNITMNAGITDSYPSKGSVWGDFDRDGFLDCYVVNWRTGSRPCYKDYFWHNNGDGTFSDWSSKVGIYISGLQAYSQPPYAGMGVTAGDYNNDGFLDIYVSNYLLAPNYLWENQGDGTFKNVAFEKNATGNNKRGGYYGHSAGSAFADYDNDGDMDIWVSNLAHKDPWRADLCDDSMLLENLGFPNYTFKDIRKDTKIPTIPKGTVQDGYYKDELFFSVNWADYDNDGYLDLFVPQVKNMSWAHSYIFKNNGDRTFKDVSDDVGLRVWNAINGAWCDYDNDGDLDLVVDGKVPYENGTYAVRLFRNNGNNNNYLQVKLVGIVSNRFAVGAKVTLSIGDNIMTREIITTTGSHGSQDSMILTFGVGSYSGKVNLNITWPSGITTVERDINVNQRITIYEKYRPIITECGASSTEINEDEEVIFIAMGKDINEGGKIVKYEWDFDGDGHYDWESSTEKNAHHTYTKNGTYNATFRVTNNFGATNTSIIHITVKNIPPVAHINAPMSAEEDSPILFDASESYDTPSDIESLLFKWDFGDGNGTNWSENMTATHTYYLSGDYNITLNVMDDDGDTSVEKRTIIIYNAPPEVYVNATYVEGWEDEKIEFKGYANDTPSDIDRLIYKWDFGDGNTTDWLDNPYAEHTYIYSGNYTCKLIVEDDDEYEVYACATVRIKNVPPQCRAGEDIECYEEEIVEFDDGEGWDSPSDMSTLTYRWNFGDGNNTNWSDDIYAEHAYAQSGRYTATLYIKDDDGFINESSIEVYVENIKPKIEYFRATKTSLREDSKVEFTVKAKDSEHDMMLLRYYWDFGDGVKYYGNSTEEHIYTKKGRYDVSVSVYDNENESAFSVISIKVKNVPPEIISASANKTKIYVGEDILFSVNASDTISDVSNLKYFWDFGDNTTAWGKEVRHTYKSYGKYIVKVIVSDDDGDQDSRIFHVEVKSLPIHEEDGEKERKWDITYLYLGASIITVIGLSIIIVYALIRRGAIGGRKR